MDPWPQLVYLEADGQKAIHEFVYQLAAKYGRNESIPHELDKTIINVMDILLNDKLVELLDSKKDLPEHLKKPRSKLKS